MKRMLRYDPRGRKSHQLSIPVSRKDILTATDPIYYNKPTHNLSYEVMDWLNANCSEDFRVFEGRDFVDVQFQSERDATLFWTFHA